MSFDFRFVLPRLRYRSIRQSLVRIEPTYYVEMVDERLVLLLLDVTRLLALCAGKRSGGRGGGGLL